VESQIEQTQRENARRFSLALSVVQIWFFLLGISYFSALAFRLIGINIIMSFYTIVVLLMRQGRELFKTSSSSKVNQ
jgi:hypothetical protein